MASNFYVAGAAAMTSERDDWETPQALFDRLDGKYHFTLDPCSTDANAKCERHYTVEDDGLSQDWSGETVFCNPPYGRRIGDWYAKCAWEAERGAGIVLLAPARTDTRAFHDYIYRNPRARIEFLRGRLRFEMGGGRTQQRTVPLDAGLLQLIGRKEWRGSITSMVRTQEKITRMLRFRLRG